MGKYTVTYQTTMYYEVEVEADSPEKAREMVEFDLGDAKPYDIDSEVTGVYGGNNN